MGTGSNDYTKPQRKERGKVYYIYAGICLVGVTFSNAAARSYGAQAIHVQLESY